MDHRISGHNEGSRPRPRDRRLRPERASDPGWPNTDPGPGPPGRPPRPGAGPRPLGHPPPPARHTPGCPDRLAHRANDVFRDVRFR
ncbi:hypothetical protein GTW30_18240 [Streptomyces sp. SID7810]|nr:hypothetical protein [Streptomyces sp. SID7810]